MSSYISPDHQPAALGMNALAHLAADPLKAQLLEKMHAHKDLHLLVPGHEKADLYLKRGPALFIPQALPLRKHKRKAATPTEHLAQMRFQDPQKSTLKLPVTPSQHTYMIEQIQSGANIVRPQPRYSAALAKPVEQQVDDFSSPMDEG